MVKTLEKIVSYAMTTYKTSIGKELRTRKKVTIPKPEHSDEVLKEHEEAIDERQFNHEALCNGINLDIAALQESDQPNRFSQIAKLEMQLRKAERDIKKPLPISLTGDALVSWSSALKTHETETAALAHSRRQAFGLILGQCTQRLKDKMESDAAWDKVQSSDDPLLMLSLIEKCVYAQTEDNLPCANIWDMMKSLTGFHQDEGMSHADWYDKFNTRINVAVSVGMSFQHTAILEYALKREPNISAASYEDLDDSDKESIQKASVERLLAYIFISQSKESRVKDSLQQDYSKGIDMYPATRLDALRMLNTFSSKPKTSTGKSEGTSFSQKGSNGKTQHPRGGKASGGEKKSKKDSVLNVTPF
jgi:hypothetical protein